MHTTPVMGGQTAALWARPGHASPAIPGQRLEEVPSPLSQRAEPGSGKSSC